MLHQRFPLDGLASLILPLDQWRPFPTTANRDPSTALRPDVRRTAVERGEARLGFTWPALPATLALEFARDGNRDRYQSPCFLRRSALAELVLAECVDGQGRFIDDVVNGVWAICEESAWVIPAHLNMQGTARACPIPRNTWWISSSAKPPPCWRGSTIS